MTAHLRACLWLLVLTVLLCSVLYPLVLYGIAQTVFRNQADGSLIADARGRLVGSGLIAQPFTADEYFQPRPSAVSYNAAASGASNWAASNYLLRDRVAQQLGPIAKYRSGVKAGQLVGPDLERWFQKDRYADKSGIVAQWAALHPTVAQNWVKADKLRGEYVAAWQKAHSQEVAQWVRDNPDTPEPKPEDLAVPFFTSFSKDHPGMFPSAVVTRSVSKGPRTEDKVTRNVSEGPVAEHNTAEGKTTKQIEPVKAGAGIQAVFFDLWLQAHPDADLAPVPADMVMASGSGLDPHITLGNALWQLDRVAAAWAKKTGRDQDTIRGEIEKLLRQMSFAPLAGLVGVPLVNVLEVNLALRERYGKARE